MKKRALSTPGKEAKTAQRRTNQEWPQAVLFVRSADGLDDCPPGVTKGDKRKERWTA